MRAQLQGVRDYNDALKEGHTAGPNTRRSSDVIARYLVTKQHVAVTDIVDMAFAKAAAAELGPYKGRTG